MPRIRVQCAGKHSGNHQHAVAWHFCGEWTMGIGRPLPEPTHWLPIPPLEVE